MCCCFFIYKIAVKQMFICYLTLGEKEQESALGDLTASLMFIHGTVCGVVSDTKFIGV